MIAMFEMFAYVASVILYLSTPAEEPYYRRSSGGFSRSFRKRRRTGSMSFTDPIKISVTSIEHILVFRRSISLSGRPHTTSAFPPPSEANPLYMLEQLEATKPM